MRLNVTEALVPPDRGERVAGEPVLDELTERRDRESVSVDEHQHVLGRGLLADQRRESIQLRLVTQRSPELRGEIRHGVETTPEGRVDSFQVCNDPVRAVEIPCEVVQLDVDPATRLVMDGEDVDHRAPRARA